MSAWALGQCVRVCVCGCVRLHSGHCWDFRISAIRRWWQSWREAKQSGGETVLAKEKCVNLMVAGGCLLHLNNIDSWLLTVSTPEAVCQPNDPSIHPVSSSAVFVFIQPLPFNSQEIWKRTTTTKSYGRQRERAPNTACCDFSVISMRICWHFVFRLSYMNGRHDYRAVKKCIERICIQKHTPCVASSLWSV